MTSSKIWLLIIFSLTLIWKEGSCQSWHPLSSGFDAQAKCLLVDSARGLLYAGGNFAVAGGVPASHVAVWNGQNWDSLGTGSRPGTPVYSLGMYHDTLYAGSYFNGGPITGLGRWNGQNWDTVSSDGVVFCMKENGGQFYLGGGYSRIGNVQSQSLAKYDGITYYSFPLPWPSFTRLYAIEFFQNKIILGGNFYAGIGMSDLCYWDGSALQPIGSGNTGSGQINALAIYQNELYIGGYFTKAEGNAGDHIMKWDGITLSEVGGGLNQQIISMKVYDNELYVAGAFTNAGGINVTDYMAKWNGSNWSRVSNGQFGPAVLTDINFMNGQLYVTGNFLAIDGTTMNNIAMYDGISKTNEINSTLKILDIYPNPVHDFIKINTGNFVLNSPKIIIRDPIGKIVFQEDIFPFTDQIELNVSSLAKGVYLLSMEDGKLIQTKKIVID